jgi:hypothetical protein
MTKRLNSLDDSSMRQLHCSNEECNAHYPTPLYNVNAKGTQKQKPQWVCVDHIPRTMEYGHPIGLHGEELKRWKGK